MLIIMAELFGRDEVLAIIREFSLTKNAMRRIQNGQNVRLPDGSMVVGVAGMRNYLKAKGIRLSVNGRPDRAVKKPTMGKPRRNPRPR